MMATPAAPPSAGAATPTRPGDEGGRYPGVHSFQEHERRKFWGRSSASAELLLRVLSVPLLLQFAPSGVGKTSLLNAGLFPALRPHNYFPFIVRLNKTEESLTQAVRRSLVDAARDFGLVEPVFPAQADNLRALLAGTQLWSAELLLLTPVLVFDQFEEVFTLHDEAFRGAFAVQLGELLAAPRAQAAAATTNTLAAPAVKIILSLREEYLGQLEQFSASIPDLFRERLRLAPLSAAEAAEAMVEPARASGKGWKSPPFEFEPQCLEALIDFIDGASDSYKVIEALTLQLVCQRAEGIAMQRTADKAGRRVLVLEDFGGLVGLERLVRSYYQDELGKLPDATARRNARTMFEEGLLDPAGKRLMLEQNEIKRRYGLDKSALDQLVNGSLLRREPRNESVFYEISHDRLTETIAKNRKTRLPRWVWPTMAAGVLVMAGLLANIVFVERQAAKTERARDKADYALQLQLGEDLVSRLRDAGLSDALKRVLQQSQGEDLSAEHVKGLAAALKLRHEGDIERDQGTLGKARDKFKAALAQIDTLAPGPIEGEQHLLQVERARLRQRLAALTAEAGEAALAEVAYGEAVRLWDVALKGPASWQDTLDAAEARLEFALLKVDAGDWNAAEIQYFEGTTLATKVLRSAFDEVQRGGTDANFKLGRAMQVFADAALGLAWFRSDEAKTRRAVALAREAVRLRPMSFQARKQLGTALVAYGARVVDKPIDLNLLGEARKLFDELGQYDPANRRMQRERAALQMAIAEGVFDCTANPRCSKDLPPGALDEAKLATLEAAGDFRWLSGLNRESRALLNDTAWGLRARAAQLAAAGTPALALPLLDEAIAITRSGGAAARTSDARLRLSELLQGRAKLLDKAGASPLALATLDQATEQLASLPPTLLGVQYSRINALDARITLLRKSGQGAQAEQARQRRSEQVALLPKLAWESRSAAAKALNMDAVEMAKQLVALGGAAKMQQLRQILDKHKQAVVQDPFVAVFWQNLGYTHQKIANLAANDTGAGGAAATMQESELRDALTTLWMSAVLSAEGANAERLAKMYEARRGLAMLLRDKKDAQVLSLVEQGVLDAKELWRKKSATSPDALFYLADANLGLAMLRDEFGGDAGIEGWQESWRVAMLHGEKLAAMEPTNARRQNWLGLNRAYFATRLEQRKEPAAAAEERKLALQACREGLRLAEALPSPDKDAAVAAKKCVEDLAERGVR